MISIKQNEMKKEFISAIARYVICILVWAE